MIRPICLLHLSDLQFGRNHRFAQRELGASDAAFDSLLQRLLEDLGRLKDQEGRNFEIDLLLLTGDVAEWGRRSEFQDARRFLRGLAEALALPPERLVLIPGNHDVNRDSCEAYFKECAADEREPSPPYWPKWKHFVGFFDQVYGGAPAPEFTEDFPWSFFEVPQLKVVVAGLNSTMAESHRPEDHYGEVGERQLAWFKERLAPYQREGWLRIGAVHHNVCRGATSDDENLRDADDLKRILGGSLNLLLHGHTHAGKLDWVHPRLPILATGSAALGPGQRPSEVPNQFQIVRIWPDRFCRWTRGYAPDEKRWIGDNRASADGSRWWDEERVDLEAVGATFLATAASSAPAPPAVQAPEESRELHFRVAASMGAAFAAEKRDDFLARVEAVCSLRWPAAAQVERIQGGAAGDYLRVVERVGDIARVFPVGAIEGEVTREAFDAFLRDVDGRYRRTDSGLVSLLVYGGEPAPDSLVREAEGRRVHLVSFVAFQGLIDFRRYVERQSARLEADPIYPPRLYVPQRLRPRGDGWGEESADALGMVSYWLNSPSGRFVLLLGDFGTGKTFLLHELARLLGASPAMPVPVLLQMRSLEKGRSLDALLAQHFAQEGMEGFSPTRFRYMLEQGRIALLFDGFDELALRVTYPRATEHFDTLLEAAAGAAKVVVTSRRQHFLSDRQVMSALGERVEQLSGRRIGLLQPFDREQIRGFLMRSCGGAEPAARRLDLLERVKDLMGLSHNPRLLGFIAELPEAQLEDAGAGGREITAAQLYQLLFDHWLVQEFERVHPQGAPPGLSLAERWRAVTALAVHLWRASGRSVQLGELSGATSAVLAALGQTALDPGVALFQVGSGTLLARDEEGNFSFLHESVLEWLVARAAAAEIDAGGPVETLEVGEMSPLMTDFVASLAERENAVRWAGRTLAAAAADLAKKNALHLLGRLGEVADQRIDLSRRDLAGQDLSSRDLADADLSHADLTAARLVAARLTGARLGGARLAGADLSWANLAGADLTGADLTGARLLGADLRGACFEGAVLRRAKLVGARLNGKELEGADTFGAAITADFLDAWLSFSLQGRPSSVLAWSPDGSLLASCAASRLRLFEAATGLELRRFHRDQSRVRSLEFSPDGRLLASGDANGTARLFAVDTGREVGRYVGEISISAVTFSSDGAELVLVLDNGERLVLDSRLDAVIRRLMYLDPTDMAFSSNGVVAFADAEAVRFERAGKEVAVLESTSALMENFALSADGTLLATAVGPTVRILALPAGSIRASIRGPRDIADLSFSPDGKLLAVTDLLQGGRILEVTGGKLLIDLDEYLSAGPLAFSPDGSRLATASAAEHLQILEVGTLRQTRAFRDAPWLTSLTFSKLRGIFAVGASDGLWLLSPEADCTPSRLSTDLTMSTALSADGALVTSGLGDGNIRMTEVATGKELWRFRGNRAWIRSVAFSPDGKLVATGGDDGSARLLIAATGREMRSLRGHERRVMSVAFSPGGETLATACWDHRVRLFRTRSGKVLGACDFGKEARPSSVAFRPDGMVLAVAAYQKEIAYLDARSGALVDRFGPFDFWIDAVAFSPDGSLLAATGKGSVLLLLTASTGRLVRSLHHDAWVIAFSFSADSRRLLTASRDNTVRLWDVERAVCLALYGKLKEGWVAFSPDGQYRLFGVPAGDFWHAIRLCRFEPGELDDFIPGLRLPDGVSLLELPPWDAAGAVARAASTAPPAPGERVC